MGYKAIFNYGPKEFPGKPPPEKILPAQPDEWPLPSEDPVEKPPYEIPPQEEGP